MLEGGSEVARREEEERRKRGIMKMEMEEKKEGEDGKTKAGTALIHSF